MINWLEVEGVRYEGQGDMIHCQTAVGFHSSCRAIRWMDWKLPMHRVIRWDT